MERKHITLGQWEIPASQYKTKRANVVPLSPAVQDIIYIMPKIGSHIFTTLGDKPFDGFSKLKKQLDNVSGVTGWRLHDIRRTLRSLMSKAGVRGDIAERVLGHVIAGVAGVYDRHDYFNEKREALRTLEQALLSIIKADGAASVNETILRAAE